MHASQLYSRNMSNFLQLIVKRGELNIDLADEIIAVPALRFAGQIVNQRVAEALKARAVDSRVEEIVSPLAPTSPMQVSQRGTPPKSWIRRY